MTLQAIKCTDFRCLHALDLQPEPGYNLIYGANASGKTSILEAIAYLGRGRSFRGAAVSDLVRHGADEFVLFGQADIGPRTVSLGVRNSRSGLEIHVDGEKGCGAATLAESLPLQVIDPDVHNLVAGGPELRRRYLDWIAFHVEHGYLDTWRRFRRALKQRNASLRTGGSGLASWDKELAEVGAEVHETRQRVVARVSANLEEIGKNLLEGPVSLDYQQGWSSERSLFEALQGSSEREQQTGSTQSGPHRADLKLGYDDHKAKKRVSRGQQKLLSCALVLAATDLVQDELEKPLLLLLDDPAAELDRNALGRLMSAVTALGSQVIATSLEPSEALFPEKPRLFHVEQGALLSVE